jgi:hypothetical protein
MLHSVAHKTGLRLSVKAVFFVVAAALLYGRDREGPIEFFADCTSI